MSEQTLITINTGQVSNDGTGESLRDAFQAVNDNFANIWQNGPVNTQVIISNNRVSTNEINLDLLISGNGIANVSVASALVPNVDGVYNLGSENRRWDEVNALYYYGNGRFLTGISGGNGGGGGTVYFQPSAPDPANIGDIWIESDTGVQYIYFNDNTSNQWAEMEAYQSFGGGTNSNGYANANVVAYGEAGWAGNIIPAANVTYSLGNSTNWWSNVWLAANTVYIGGVALGVSGNVLTVDGEAVLSNNSNSSITTTGNITAGIMSADYVQFLNTGSVTESYISETGFIVGSNNSATLATLQAQDVRIITDFNGGSTTWTFGNDGVLTTPGDISINGGLDLSAGILTTATNSSLQAANGGLLSLSSTDANTTSESAVRVYVDTADNANNRVYIYTDNQGTGDLGIWVFAPDGTLSLPGDTAFMDASTNFVGIYPDSSQNNGIELYTTATEIFNTGNINVIANVAGTVKTWTFGNDGELTAPGQISAQNISVSGTIQGTLEAPDGNTSILINRGGVIGVSSGFNYDYAANTMYAPTGSFSGTPQFGVQGFYVGVPGYTILGSPIAAQFTTDINSYSQLNQQNINNKSLASGDYIITADNGTDNTYYLDIGLAGSNHADPDFFGDTSSFNDGYFYVTAQDQAGPSTSSGPGNLIIGSTNGVIKMFVGNTAQANVIAQVDSQGISVTGNVDANYINVIHDILADYIEATANIAAGNVIVTGTLYGLSGNVSGTMDVGTDLDVGGNIDAGNVIATGILQSTNSTGDEGGEIRLAAPAANTVISGGVIVDAYRSQLRFIESGGNNRGLYVDFSTAPDGQASAAIGYRDIPQVAFVGNVTLGLTDAGKHYYATLGGGTYSITIPDNANVAFPVGTAVTLVMGGAGNLQLLPQNSTSLYLAGNSTAGNRTVGDYGMATLIKVETNKWFINGTGVS